MRRIASDASCVRLTMVVGATLLGLLVPSGCECKSRQSDRVAADASAADASSSDESPSDEPPVPHALRPDAPMAPRWHAPRAKQSGQPVHEKPAGEDRPAYRLPLDIHIENVPEVPPEIKGPLPDKKKTLRWFSFQG